MDLIIKVTNSLSCLWLAYCVTMFYIMLYGDESKVVHRWPSVQHWGLKIGIISIITGSVFSALSWDKAYFGETVLNIGLALVFNWAYAYHKKLLMK